jgi:transcriptional regulator with XRE-family HTH domain
VNADDARTIGARLRQIRKSRGKSLAVIAGLAGISAPTLSRIETGRQRWIRYRRSWAWPTRCKSPFRS